MQRSLATSAIACAQLLDQVSTLLRDPANEARSALRRGEIEDQAGRFRVWAGNLGAFQRLPSTSSLDHRLRESPKVAGQVIDLLQDLQDTAQIVSDIASGERPNRQYDAEDDSEDDFVPDDDDDELGEANNDSTETEKLKTPKEPLSEGQELFESIKETIASLFRISIIIRNASPRDRFARALQSNQPSFDSSFDINHVGQKFPLLDSKEKKWLKERLGKAITNRRQYLRYARDHRYKLGKERQDVWQPNDKEERRTQPALTVDWTRAPQESQLKPPVAESTLASTSASTLRPTDVQIQEEDFRDDQSQTSYAMSLNDENEALELPRLEDVAKGVFPFECPLCWTIQNTKKESSWRKHVFSDLRPYVCTFGKCDVKLFADRRDWFDHEMQVHRNQWVCHFCDREGFQSLERFHDHLRKHHSNVATADQLDAICEASKRPIDQIPASDCPFCNVWEGKLREVNPDIPVETSIVVTPAQFRHHVGSHMQQLALFAIPRGHLQVESEGDSAASAEAVAFDKIGSSKKHSSVVSYVSIPSLDSDTNALEKQRLALQQAEDKYGLEHTTTVEEVENLAFLLVDLRKHDEAEELFKRALNSHAERFGSDDPLTCKAAANLGDFYRRKGLYEMAEEMYNQALQGYERTTVYSINHDRNMADVINHLGDVYSSQHRLEEAETFYQRAKKAYQNINGPQHPSTLDMIKKLSDLFVEKTGLDEAENKYRNALESSEKENGLFHKETLQRVGDLGSVLFEQTKYEEAELMYRRVMEGYEKMHGPKHLMTLDKIHYLALVLDRQKKYEESIMMYEKALGGYEETSGLTELGTLHCCFNYALALTHTGKNVEAEMLYRRALEGYELQLGMKDLTTINTLKNLGLVLHHLSKFEEAGAMLVRAVRGFEVVLGPEDPAYLNTLSYIGATLDALGRYRDAELYYREAFGGLQKATGPESSDTQSARQFLAYNLSYQGLLTEAIDTLVIYHQIQQRRYGDENKYTLSALRQIEQWREEAAMKVEKPV